MLGCFIMKKNIFPGRLAKFDDLKSNFRLEAQMERIVDLPSPAFSS